MLRADIANVSSVETEVNISRLFADLANRRGVSDALTLQLRLLENPTICECGWSRRMRDAFLLCLDRAVARVYPPLDPLQYTQPPPEFQVEEGVHLVRLQVMPSSCVMDFIPVPHHVEAGDESLLEMQSEGVSVAGCNSCDERGEGMGAQPMEEEGASEDKVEAACARRRWKTAAWLTARFFNEGSWCPVERTPASSSGDHVGRGRGRGGGGAFNGISGSSIVDVAMRHGEKRFLHVDVIGMEIVGLLVGITSRYAYVAVPQLQEGQRILQWVLVTRVAVPSALAAMAPETTASTRKRPRYSSRDNAQAQFLHQNELMSHDMEPLQELPPGGRMKVTVRAHKVYCKRQRAVTEDAPMVSIVFEDVGIVGSMEKWSETNAAECFTFYSDVMHIVGESCTRFIRGYDKYGKGSGSGSAEQLFVALTDTVSVRLKKTRERGCGRSPVTVMSPHEIQSLFEGTCVEFKAKIEKWQDGGDNMASSSSSVNKGTVNLERIRHTIAAMASTLGGVLLIGVTDDGKVIGHPREAMRELRLSGFCPAMTKGNVVLNEMRAVKGEKAAALPKDWWKKKQEQQTAEAEAERLVTVVTVGRGQAPFYTTSRHSVPYTRGFASTVPLSVIVCARRVANLLP